MQGNAQFAINKDYKIIILPAFKCLASGFISSPLNDAFTILPSSLLFLILYFLTILKIVTVSVHSEGINLNRLLTLSGDSLFADVTKRDSKMAGIARTACNTSRICSPAANWSSIAIRLLKTKCVIMP